MKFTAQLNPITNPNVSNLSEQERWMQNVNNKVNLRKPLNSPNVVSQKVQSNNTRTLIQLGSLGTGLVTGLWDKGNADVRTNQYLQNPESYKLTNINDLNLRTSISWQQTVPFTSAPTPDGDYSMFYYVVVEKQAQGLFAPQEWYLVMKFEFNYDDTAQEFNWTSQVKNLQLRDTIGERETVDIGFGEYPNFTVNPEKITTLQYQELTTQDVTLNILGGFDSGQLDTLFLTPNPVLSANNKAHFEYFLYGNTLPGDNVSFFDISTTLVFTYSGLFADFTPIS